MKEETLTNRFIYHISYDIQAENLEESSMLESILEKRVQDLSKMNYSRLFKNTYVIVSEGILDFNDDLNLNLIISPKIKTLVSMVAEIDGKFQLSNRTN